MTRDQERVVEKLKRMIPEFDFYGEMYEIKELKIEEYESFVSFYLVTGMKGDEGSLAACLCRKYRHCFIGKRGGIRVPRFKRIGSHSTHSASAFQFMNECYHH